MIVTRWQQPNPTIVLPDGPTRGMRQMASRLIAALALGLGIAGIDAGPCEATAISVNIDTSALAAALPAGTVARLDFALLDGDFVADNSVTISNFSTDGTLMAFDCSLGCLASGPPPSFTLDDSLGIGQFLQDLTLGSHISFDVVFSADFSGLNAPDRLTLNLLDSSSNLSLVDTDLDFLSDPVPAQDALLLIDLRDGGQLLVASVTNPSTPVSVAPEPNTVVLFVLGMLALATCRTRGARRLVLIR
jgi:hypothetical protein